MGLEINFSSNISEKNHIAVLILLMGCQNYLSWFEMEFCLKTPTGCINVIYTSF